MLARRLVSYARCAWTPHCFIPLPLPRIVPARGLSSDLPGSSKNDQNGSPSKDGVAQGEGEDGLFAEENIKGMSPVDVARLRVVYEYVKEHAEIVEAGKPPLDPESNPLIDPRSFDVKTLPKVPEEALKQFRKDLPADAAREARPLPTKVVWDGAVEELSASAKKELAALVGTTGNDTKWAAVDERTMDPFYLARMRRQSISSKAAPPAATQTAFARQPALGAGRPRKRRCRLSDSRGRVSVDYREIGVLSAFMNEHGKIMHRKKTSLSAKAQRKLNRAVKTARQMALIHPEPRPGLSLEEMQAMESENL